LLAKMIELLDEYIPLCCGFRINDDPADGSWFYKMRLLISRCLYLGYVCSILWKISYSDVVGDIDPIGKT
jgi:hypothetical protein